MKSREPRRKVMLKARMRVASAWHDACILNLSSRGLMLQTSNPPVRNSYLEIRRGPHVIVARVMWAKGQRVGLLAQDPLPVEAIVTQEAVPERGVCAKPVERRRVPRGTTDRAEANRRWGQRLQYLVIALAGACAAVIAAVEAREALASPMDAVAATLRSRTTESDR